jgi:hypothetical protein
VSVDTGTHEDLERLAAEFDTSVGHTATLAERAQRQERIGADLSAPLRADEQAWLKSELG